MAALLIWAPKGATAAESETAADAQSAQDTESSQDEDGLQPASPNASYSYKVDLNGLDETGLKSALKERSDLVRLQDEEPASIWDLRARIRRDINGFAEVMRAEGYFGAKISYDVDRSQDPIRVTIDVTPGKRFSIGEYTIELDGPEGLSNDVRQMAQKRASEQVGKPARSETIASAFGTVMRKLPEAGYPRAKLAEQDFTADHRTEKLTAKVHIDTGPLVRFGDYTVEGLDSVKRGVIDKVITWKEGEQYDSRKLSEFRQTLTEMNLFASIQIDTDDPLKQGNQQPIHIKLRESDHRSVGATASYSTVNGFGGSVFWEHRNLFGAGERLKVEAEADQKLQQLTADLTKPRFLRNDQKLLLGAEVAREDTDAFLEYRGLLRAAVEREINERLRVRLGPELSYIDTTDAFSPSKSVLLGLLGQVSYDHTDDLLDPKDGYRLGLKVAPYLVFGDAKNFVRMEGTASVYYSLDNAGNYVAAARVKVGSLVGADDIRNVPASKRFYSGGGNSIRGYDYQAIGPLDVNGDPIGGRSLFEVGAEMRIKITQTWGVVPFIEGGSVFDSQVPDFSRKLRWGAGLGVRYYTGFGPLRVDVGFPINGRPQDDDFQIYVSIGQAF